MSTIKQIKEILEAYCADIRTIDSHDKEEYNNQLDKKKEELKECFNLLRDQMPGFIQMNMPSFFSKPDVSDQETESKRVFDNAKNFIDKIKSNAQKRFSLDAIPTGRYLCDKIQGDSIYTPEYIDWQKEDNPYKNIVINFNNESKKDAKSLLNSLLLNILISLPVKSVNLNIFDFNMTGMSDLFTLKLPKKLYHDDIIMTSEQAGNRLKSLLEHMGTVMQKYGNLSGYNSLKGEIAMPYEIIVLCGYPYHYDSYIDQLIPLFENGNQCGVYFIVLNNTDTDYQLSDKKRRHLLDIHNYRTFDACPISISNGLISHTPITCNPLLMDECFNYINEEANKVEKRAIINQDFSSLQEKEYVQTISEIEVTIGLDIEDKHPVTVKFNSGDYIHAFILGQSGSGKSVLLNNIITSAILKYSPQDLMLYLMDFKGVEFNRYRGLKHTKAVLVDNSDPQMTLEVLRELRDENKRRVKLWQKENVSNIDGYNKKYPTERLPQILFVADECQVMFKESVRGTELIIQREIAEILNIIATQGRSQGIHMLLATQQLDETNISGQILKNLTECFLLMSAPGDSDRLVPDSSDITSNQKTGIACYYHKRVLQSQVQTYFAKNEELESAIELAQTKAIDIPGNGEHYCCGSSMLYLKDDESRILSQWEDEKWPCAVIGHNLSLEEKLTTIQLKRDFTENILFFGTNKQEQTIGVVLNALISLIGYNRYNGKNFTFKVIDCIGSKDAIYKQKLQELQKRGLCEVIDRLASGILLDQLTNDISNRKATPTILTIIGNEKFIEMKRKSPLISSEAPIKRADNSFDISTSVISMDFVDNNPYSNDDAKRQELNQNLAKNGKTLSNVTDSKAEEDVMTYPKALMFILDEGPMQDVHVLMQVDNPTHILFEDFPGKTVEMFRHKVILRSENKYLQPFRFSVDIDVETLGDDEERLRAYYYPEDGGPQLFTPYQMPRENDMKYLK